MLPVENHSKDIEIQDSVGKPETCRRCFVTLTNILEHLKINKNCSKYYFIEEQNEHKISLEVQQENMLKILKRLNIFQMDHAGVKPDLYVYLFNQQYIISLLK